MIDLTEVDVTGAVQSRYVESEGRIHRISEKDIRTSGTKQVTTYNEDEEEDPFEEDEDDMTPNNYAYIEDTGPAIDKVLDHRPKKDIGKGLKAEIMARLMRLQILIPRRL